MKKVTEHLMLILGILAVLSLSVPADMVADTFPIISSVAVATVLLMKCMIK